MAWGVNNCGWWGEGEIKFYLDGDGEFPTICGTGTEDYFCGSYNFDVGQGERRLPRIHHALRRPAPGDPAGRALRLPDALRPVPLAHHGPHPLRAGPAGDDPGPGLAAAADGYLPLQDDIASVAYWYQTLPTAPFPKLPDKDYLEVI